MALSPRASQTLGLTISFTTVAAFVVALRFYTRFVYMRNAGREDYLIGLALLFSIGLNIAIGRQIKYGMGQHAWELPQDDLINSMKPFWWSIWIYYMSLTFTKCSIIIQYLRIFPTEKFCIAGKAVLGVVIIYGVWTFLDSIFLCYPVAYFWNKNIPGGKCMNQHAIWFSNAALNIATDFAIIILPMPVLQQLNLRKRQKYALMGIFALGGFVCLISILRLHSLVAISNSPDPTYDNPPAATWSSLETSVGIICACLPYMKPLLARHFPETFGTTRRQSAYPEDGQYENPCSETRSQGSKIIVRTDLEMTTSEGEMTPHEQTTCDTWVGERSYPTSSAGSSVIQK